MRTKRLSPETWHRDDREIVSAEARMRTVTYCRAAEPARDSMQEGENGDRVPAVLVAVEEEGEPGEPVADGESGAVSWAGAEAQQDEGDGEST